MPPHSVDLVGRDAELEELCSRLGIVTSPAAPDAPDAPTAAGAAGAVGASGASVALGVVGAAESGTGAVLLAGDAGVGKTRLLSELRDRALLSGWKVVAGHCLDLSDSALAYLPFSEILGRLVVDLPDVTEATLVDQPVLRRLQPGRRVRTVDGDRDESPLERADLYEAMHVLLERAAERGPLLVVVEDAHWADRSTRDLLSFLFTRPFAAPVALVVSYRSDDLHRRHPLRQQVAQWSRLRVHRMQLEPLDGSAVRSLVRALHPDPIAEHDVDDIVARAEGNAFFVEELVGATWATGGVPADLAEVLLVRLDRLDEDAQQVVRTAAVAGRRVGHHLLAAVSGLADGALEDAVRAAVEMHVLEPVGRDSYSFRHALLAEAVYDDLLPGERVRRHAAYAKVLQSGAVPGTSAELARHARLGQDVPTALAASIDAGAEAMRVGGPDEAAQHYELAMELLADPAAASADVDATDLALRTADALTAAGHIARASSVLRESLTRLPADAPAVDRGRLLSQLALGLDMMDVDHEALELARQAVELVAEGTEVQQVRVRATYARILAGQRQEQEAREVGTAALALSQRLDMPRLSADILTTLAGLKRDHLLDDVRDALQEVIEEARTSGAVNAELRGLYTLGRFHQDRGEMEEALAAFDAGLARGAQTGLSWAPYSFDALIMRGSLEYVLGRWDDALGTAARARQAPSAQTGAMLRSLGAMVAAARGRADAPDLLARLRPHWSQEGLLAIQAAGAELELAEQRADPVAARATYAHAVDVLGTMWRPLFLARLRLAALTLGVLATSAARRTHAEREAERSAADSLLDDGRRVVAYIREEGLVVGPEAHAWTLRLEAEHLRWRWVAQVDPPEPEGLVETWCEVEERFVAYGHMHEVARIRVRMLEVLRGLGESERARRYGDAAREAATQLRAQPLLDELLRLGSTRQPAGRPERSSRTGAGRQEVLTPREREILALVAEGRTNGEIGGQLFISTKTVSVHVSNILGKLGAASRTEAAAIARRDGLLA